MRQDQQDIRKNEIEAAAYTLLAEKGFGGMSMLTLAKTARASNETLYRWYGDKLGLVSRMIARNAAEARELAETALSDDTDPEAALRQLAPILLAMLLGDRAIALNRAAATDPSGALGQALAEQGRNTLGPLITQILGRLPLATPPDAAFDRFMSLLVGDLQMRRAIGVLPPPSQKVITARAKHAVDDFLTLSLRHGR
ncbi:MAG: TetR/AcrR family transcriptional regulator [Pseudomonadota bacterium]